jgi:hypothetical protein
MKLLVWRESRSSELLEELLPIFSRPVAKLWASRWESNSASSKALDDSMLQQGLKD